MPEDTDTTTDESTEQQTEQQPAVAEVQAQDMPDPKSPEDTDTNTDAESGDESGAASEEQQADEQTADSGADQQAAEDGASAAATDESKPREVNTDETTSAVDGGMLSDLLERAANSVDSLDELQSVAGRSDEFVEGYVEGASAKSEAASQRDGLLSWKGETHALAIGIGAGFALGSQGDKRLVGAIVAAGLYGSRGGNRLNDSFAKQVRRELPYAAAGIVIGVVIGLAAAGDLGTALSSVAV